MEKWSDDDNDSVIGRFCDECGKEFKEGDNVMMKVKGKVSVNSRYMKPEDEFYDLRNSKVRTVHTDVWGNENCKA